MMRRIVHALFVAGIIISLSQAALGAVATVGADTIKTLGAGATSQTITAAQTPIPGDVMILALLAKNGNVSPSPPAGFTLACSNTTNGAYVWYHIAGSSENPAYGTLTWTSSQVATDIMERSGMNTATPIDKCASTTVPGTNLTPTLALGGPTNQNEVGEGLFMQNAPSNVASCTGGAGTCNQAGWTERSYRVANSVLGEQQFDASTAPQGGVSTLMNINTSTSNTMWVMGWYDNPTPTTPWSSSCYGATLLGMVGC